MADPNDDYSDIVSRRQFVATAGASGAAALAGCASDGNGSDGGDGGSGSGGSGSDGGDSDGGSGVVDTALIGATNNGVPSNLHVNPMGTQNYDWIAGNHIFERFAAYNFSTQEFELAGLSDWSFDGTTVTLTLRDDLAWDHADDDLREYFSSLADVRKQTDALSADGDLQRVDYEVEEGWNDRVVAYARATDAEAVVVVLNFGEEPATVSVPEEAADHDIIADEGVGAEGAAVSVDSAVVLPADSLVQ